MDEQFEAEGYPQIYGPAWDDSSLRMPSYAFVNNVNTKFQVRS